MQPTALTIAGSDPSGGAGIQADLKTFHQFGVYGMAVLTLLTVQNTRRVRRVEPVDADLVREQTQAVLEDIPPDAVKTGALGTAATIEAVADCLATANRPLVVDPILVSTHGAALLEEDALRRLVDRLLPLATLVTPNLPEAAALAGMEVRDLDGMERAARVIAGMGPEAVLVKGGHLAGDPVDLLYWNGNIRTFGAPRIRSTSTHGTGCTCSAAIAAGLARGLELEAAVAAARSFLTEAIRRSPGLGGGRGPLNHHAPALSGEGRDPGAG